MPPRGRCWFTEGQDHPLPDGSILLRYATTIDPEAADEPCPRLGEGRPLAVIGRYVPSTGDLGTITVLPGVERTGDPYRDHAFAKYPVLGIAHDRVYLGDTGSNTILAMSFGGDTIGAFPVPFESAAVPADAREKLFEDATVSSRGQSRSQRFTFIYPDHYPRYARLVAAPEDRVWVMAYPTFKEPVLAMELDHPVSSRRLKEGAWWKVVGRDGFPIAELRTPPGLFLLEVGDDHVLGLSMDEFLRESVQLYWLIR